MARYVYRKKVSYLVENSQQTIDYKNLPLLKSHLMESGRVMPSRVTGVSAQQQRKITKAIKLARYLALLPYTDKYTKQ